MFEPDKITRNGAPSNGSAQKDTPLREASKPLMLQGKMWVIARQRRQREAAWHDEVLRAMPGAWSRTITTWVSAGTIAAKPARKAFIAAVDTQGRTRAKSSPVAGRTAAKM